MVMKDWKQGTNLSYHTAWTNLKNAQTLFMTMESLPSLGWTVRSWKLPAKRFKTKSEALKFAKSYMRKH